MATITFYGRAVIDGKVAVFPCVKREGLPLETRYADAVAWFPNTKKGDREAADHAAALGTTRA